MRFVNAYAYCEKTLIGRYAIRAAMSRLGRDLMVFQLCSNVIDAGNVSGMSYVTLHRHFGSETIPSSMIAPEIVAEYHDRFTSTTEGWRIAEHQSLAVFKHPVSTH